MKLKRVIRMLERQRGELTEIIKILRQIDKFGVARSKHTMSVEEFDRRLDDDALCQANGNQSEAARMLRISRDRLRYKMAKYSLR